MKENERMKDVSNLEKHQEESWNRLKRDISSSAHTIHEIDAGRARGYSRALFVSSILNKVSTYAGKGEVEIVEKAVDLIREYNARSGKPVITGTQPFLPAAGSGPPEPAETEKNREKEKREVAFEGGTLAWNYEADRLQIVFENIPNDGMRKELKASGFKWSPKQQAWQRQLTQNAVLAAQRVLHLNSL